jgi:curved DNA-binding protein CbpA
MQSTMQAVERHLARRIDADALNHYALLGITTDASSIEIRNALKAAAAAWNASDRKTYPDSAMIVAKLLKQAQSDLLDEASKVKYDHSIRSNLVSAAVSPSTSDPIQNLFRPFDSSLLASTNGNGNASGSNDLASFGSVEQRWAELERAIPDLRESDEFDRTSDTRDSRDMQSDAMNERETSVQRSSSAARIEQMKRARRNKNRLALVGLFGLAFLFLGYAGFRFVWNRQQSIANAAESKANEDPITAGLKSHAPNADIKKGDRPLASRIGGSQADPSADRENMPSMPSLSRESEGNLATMIGQEPSATVPNEMGASESTAMVSETVAMNGAKPDMTKPDTPSMASGSPSDPVAASSGDSMASKEDIMKWSAAMKTAREAVDRADFTTFNKQMEIALPFSSTDEMIAKQARLDQLGQLYDIFIKSLKEAKKKVRNAEEINVGKTKVSIVELTSTELIIRRKGMNEKFAWDSIPPDMALAFAGLTLNDEAPTDLAARAVYCSLSPAKNDLSAKRAKEYFDKSIGKGEIRKDLPQALTDKYE